MTNTSYPEYKETVHLLNHKVYYNKHFPLYCFQDYGLSGEVFLFAQKDHSDRLFFIYYQIYKNMLTPELYLELFKCLAKIGYEGKLEDLIFVGDKSGNKRSRTSKTSVIQEYHQVSDGKIRIHTTEISNDEKMKTMKACLKRKIDGKPQFNVSKESTCLKFSECMKTLQLNKAGDDHVDNKFTHVVNAAEYGVAYLFPRRKAQGVVVSLDPGDKILNEETGEEVEQSGRTFLKPASAAAIVGSYRIQRKGVIYR
jgi:hypothetical protein